jgi:hypothetical protein
MNSVQWDPNLGFRGVSRKELAMPQLNAIRVIQTTADVKDANCDAGFQLQIFRSGGDVLLDFPDLPYDERERGRTDRYRFDVSGLGVDSSDPSFVSP